MCPKCGLLMLMGEGDGSGVRVSTCAYCGLATGTTSDCASFRCSNCGVSRTGLATPGANPIQACPGCGQPMPREAICCVKCGCETNRAYQNGQFAKGVDMDWLIGKDYVGHCQFARSLLNHLVASAEEVRTMDELTLRWVDLEAGLVSIEEAGSCSPGYSLASKLIPSIEQAYLALLRAELRIIQSNRNLTKKPKVFIQEPHLKARRRVEVRFRGAIPPAAAWGEKLVDFTKTMTGNYAVKNYSRLTNEVLRVRQRNA